MQYYKVKDGRLRYIFVFYWTPKNFLRTETSYKMETHEQ